MKSLKKIIKGYKRVGYNMNIMRQSVCLVVNPITVNKYGFLFNCTAVGQLGSLNTCMLRIGSVPLPFVLYI